MSRKKNPTKLFAMSCGICGRISTNTTCSACGSIFGTKCEICGHKAQEGCDIIICKHCGHTGKIRVV